MIGTLGSLTFVASSEKIKTFQSLSMKTGVRYGQHDTLLNKPTLEFLGEDLDTVTIKLLWRIEDSINPEEEMKGLEKAMKEGEVLLFFLGDKKVGSGKYVIKSISKDPHRVDNKGNLLCVEYDVELCEYFEAKKKDKNMAQEMMKTLKTVPKVGIAAKMVTITPKAAPLIPLGIAIDALSARREALNNRALYGKYAGK